MHFELDDQGPIREATEPKVRFGAILLQEDLDPGTQPFQNAQKNSNGTEKVRYVDVPLGSTPVGL